MPEKEQRFRRHAEWHALQKDTAWAVKIRQVERAREGVKWLRSLQRREVDAGVPGQSRP